MIESKTGKADILGHEAYIYFRDGLLIAVVSGITADWLRAQSTGLQTE